jgi:prephenate dehydrogenase
MSGKRVAVIGLGLIGGSLARRLREIGTEVVCFDTDPATRQTALDAGLMVSDNLSATLAKAPELAVLAIPFQALPAVLRGLATADYPGIVTDVTSVKQPAANLAEARRLRWVGGHPMAGNENSGFPASDPTLFEESSWALCLDPSTALDDWLVVAALLTQLGARVVPTTSARHDAAAARISHLPHLLASALATGASAGEAGRLALTLAAGSFRDSTRVAATRPELPAAMCGANAQALRAELNVLIERLTKLRQALESPDPITTLLPAMAEAHRVRMNWPPTAGTSETLQASRDQLLALGLDGGWVTGVNDDHQTLTSVHPV